MYPWINLHQGPPMKCFRARLKPICATLRGLGHLRTAILCDSSQMPQSKVKKKWGEDFLRACTIERHLDKSQKKYAGILMKMPEARWSNLSKHRLYSLPPKEPLNVDTLLKEKLRRSPFSAFPLRAT